MSKTDLKEYEFGGRDQGVDETWRITTISGDVVGEVKLKGKL